MQTATQIVTSPAAPAPVVASKPLKVFHATRNIQLEFDSTLSAEWGVAYAYCEENNRLSQLFAHRDDGKLDEMYAKLPMTRGKLSVACGDWMACVKSVINPSGMASPEDIRQMMEDVGIKC
jgi:hypothetical protein